MKKHLFLCGPAGCGKSRLLREELGPALAIAGGYVTEAARDESGKITGVDLLPAADRGLRGSALSGYDNRSAQKG